MLNSPLSSKAVLEPTAPLRVEESPAKRFAVFAVFLVVLSVGYWRPLFDLVRFAYHSELFSYILLVPFISAYFFRTLPKRSHTAADHSVFGALLFLGLGLATVVGGYLVPKTHGVRFVQDDYLFVTILSFVFCVVGGSFWFLGRGRVWDSAFPLGFLLFMVPFPTAFVHGLEVFFQYTSAEAANALFWLTGTPVLREGLSFALPGISIRVAEECSGIHSSLVLFITSLLAGKLFLRSAWSRAALTSFVIPLGIVRNGFRIMTIGLLCVHVDPNIINSPFHHRGGPIWFVLSLGPFFLFLAWLRRLDKRRGNGRSPAASAAGGVAP